MARTFYRFYIYAFFNILSTICAGTMAYMLHTFLQCTDLNPEPWPSEAEIVQSLVLGGIILLIAGVLAGLHYWLILRDMRADPAARGSAIRSFFLNFGEIVVMLTLALDGGYGALNSFAYRDNFDAIIPISIALPLLALLFLLEQERRRTVVRQGAAVVFQRIHFFGLYLIFLALLVEAFFSYLNSLLTDLFIGQPPVTVTCYDTSYTSACFPSTTTDPWFLFLILLWFIVIWLLYALATHNDNLRVARLLLRGVIALGVGFTLYGIAVVGQFFLLPMASLFSSSCAPTNLWFLLLTPLWFLVVWLLYAPTTRNDNLRVARLLITGGGLVIDIGFALYSLAACQLPGASLSIRMTEVLGATASYNFVSPLLLGCLVVAVYHWLLPALSQQNPLDTSLRRLMTLTISRIVLASFFWWGLANFIYNYLQTFPPISIPDPSAWTLSVSLMLVGLGYIPLDISLKHQFVHPPNSAIRLRRGFVLTLIAVGLIFFAGSIISFFYFISTALNSSIDGNTSLHIGIAAAIVGIILTGLYFWLGRREHLFTIDQSAPAKNTSSKPLLAFHPSTDKASAGQAMLAANGPSLPIEVGRSTTPPAAVRPELIVPGKPTKREVSRRLLLVALTGLIVLTLVASSIILFSYMHTSLAGRITEFPILAPGSSLNGITAGPDGNLWFTESNGNESNGNEIGRITPHGMITEFPVPTSESAPEEITAGPDGNLWFTEHFGNKIGRITPHGMIIEFPVPTSESYLNGITAGPDGNLWFTESNGNGNKIGRITPSGKITEFPAPTSESAPEEITAGPDGNLWFTDDFDDKIGRITPSGKITEFPIPTSASAPKEITAGPDGNLWFTEYNGNKIGRITPSGKITEFPVPKPVSSPDGITAGPDGNLWFTESFGNKIGRITPSGMITEFPIPTSPSSPGEITAGPDGNLWFIESFGNKIGRITLDFTIKS